MISLPSLLRRAAYSAVLLLASVPALAASDAELADKLHAAYPLTTVARTAFRQDYNRITDPGPLFTIRIPGIRADVAAIMLPVVTTDIVDGRAVPPRYTRSNSRLLEPGENVYVTGVEVRSDAVRFELLTQNVSAQADGTGDTRYRASILVHLPQLQSVSAEDAEHAIDLSLAPASPTAKSVMRGMSPDDVKEILGVPNQIVELGIKDIYVYDDDKVTFIDNKVSAIE